MKLQLVRIDPVASSRGFFLLDYERIQYTRTTRPGVTSVTPGNSNHTCPALLSARNMKALRIFKRLSFSSLLCSLLAFLSCLATPAFGYNEDETNLYDQPPARVLVEPFVVTLMVAAQPLNSVELDELLAAMEQTVEEYAREQKPSDGERQRALQSSQYGNLLWVKFNDVTQEHDEQSVNVNVGTGIFSYVDHPIPTVAEANAWIHDSLQSNLLAALRETSTFASISNVSMESPTESVPDVEEPASEEEDQSANSSGKMSVLVGAIAGAAVLLLVIALLVVKTRRKSQIEIEDLHRVESDQPKRSPRSSSAAGGASIRGEVLPRRRSLDDGRSLAGSESDFTVATEAGDSTALKSIHAKSLLLGQSSGMKSGIQMALSESFERDRQLSISKDMLTGMWSGAVQRGGRNDNVQSESVLKPSHFSASQERRKRRAAAGSSQSSSPALDSSSISSDDREDSSDLVFEQAEAWDSVSPSKASKSRTRRSSRRNNNIDIV